MTVYIPEERSRQIVQAILAAARAAPSVQVYDTSRPDEWVIVRRDGIRGNLMLWTSPGTIDGHTSPSRVTWESQTYPEAWVVLNDYAPADAARTVLEVDPRDLPTIRTDAQLRPPSP